MEVIRTFHELTMKDTNQAGGKGASLGEMTAAGIPVPPGFVVLTEVFEQFLKELELHTEIESQLASVNQHAMETIERASQQIQGLILAAKMPEDIGRAIISAYRELGAEFVAVRSSATAEDGSNASWAGELDSFLNTTEDTLLDNVRRCFASLFTPRAIFYRIETGSRDAKITVAVIIQTMVNAEVSGVAFSVHPVTEDLNQLIIEAGWGLGEAIVSGSITPDSYVIDKRDWSVIDSYRGEQKRQLIRKPTGGNEWVDVPGSQQEKNKLSQEKVIELAKLVVSIEQYYGFPCDIEWALEAGILYILQCRPITTLS